VARIQQRKAIAKKAGLIEKENQQTIVDAADVNACLASFPGFFAFRIYLRRDLIARAAATTRCNMYAGSCNRCSISALSASNFPPAAGALIYNCHKTSGLNPAAAWCTVQCRGTNEYDDCNAEGIPEDEEFRSFKFYGHQRKPDWNQMIRTERSVVK
jgi:hypothetical protein